MAIFALGQPHAPRAPVMALSHGLTAEPIRRRPEESPPDGSTRTDRHRTRRDYRFESPRDGEQRKLDLALVEVAGVVLALVYLEQRDSVRVISFRHASWKERKTYAECKERKK